MAKHRKYIIGIDEAGRGPLAGPVSVGAVCVPAHRMKEFRGYFSGVKDSKKLSPQKREVWFLKMKQAKKDGLIDFRVSLIGAQTIDRRGITRAISKGIRSVLGRLDAPSNKTKVLLDGGLKAPKDYLMQETIVRGDEKELLISLASIAAKVTRDARMEGLSRKHPKYGFGAHKGYGTAEHCKMIKKHGPIGIHRKSFIKKLYTGNNM